MPASIRIIKIVKDAMGGEAYTVEFECEAENAKDLLKELTSSPYGQRAIELLNRAEFLPEEKPESKEEMKVKAAKEEKERKDWEETLRDRGRKDAMLKVLIKLRKLYGDDFVKGFEDALNKEEQESNNHA